jgi:hypothetical protein
MQGIGPTQPAFLLIVPLPGCFGLDLLIFRGWRKRGSFSCTFSSAARTYHRLPLDAGTDNLTYSSIQAGGLATCLRSKPCCRLPCERVDGAKSALIDKPCDVVRFLSRKRSDALFLAYVGQLSGRVYRRSFRRGGNVHGFEHSSCNCSACPQSRLSASVAAQPGSLPQPV